MGAVSGPVEMILEQALAELQTAVAKAPRRAEAGDTGQRSRRIGKTTLVRSMADAQVPRVRQTPLVQGVRWITEGNPFR